MAVLFLYSADEIEETFTHYGWFCGIVPIYFNIDTTETATRNWVPDWYMDVVEMFAHIFLADGGFPFVLTKRIQKGTPL